MFARRTDMEPIVFALKTIALTSRVSYGNCCFDVAGAIGRLDRVIIVVRRNT